MLLPSILFNPPLFTDRPHRIVCKRHSHSLIQYATLGGSSKPPSYACPSIVFGTWLIHPQILFLNKIDLFAEKLPRSPLGDYFPDYTGGSDYNAACEYLLQRFVSLNQSAATKQIYAHYTCATDTNQIRCTTLSPFRKSMLRGVFPSRAECNLGYPSANSFAGMRSFVTK
jgi:hypothetical protein